MQRPKNKLYLARLIELLAIVTVGDAVVGMVQPRRHLRLWEIGPRWWTQAMRDLEHRPMLVVGLAVAQAALGLWVASLAKPPEPARPRWSLARLRR